MATAPAIGHHSGTIACGNEAGTSVARSHRLRKLRPMPRMLPPRPRNSASIRMIFSTRIFEAPRDFSMPISRVRCCTAMYMESEATAAPINTATPIITFSNGRREGNVIH